MDGISRRRGSPYIIVVTAGCNIPNGDLLAGMVKSFLVGIDTNCGNCVHGPQNDLGGSYSSLIKYSGS